MSLGFLLAVAVGFMLYTKTFTARPSANYTRLRQLYRRRLKAEARLRRGQSPYTRHKEHTVCNRCARRLDPAPTLETVRDALGDGEVPTASTGCELTDQIFEAARKKGIVPVDVIGPAPNYDD